MRTLLRIATTAAVAATQLLTPRPAAAQTAPDVKYTAVTRLEFGGRLGRTMRFVRQGGKPDSQTVWISGTTKRLDRGKKTEIADAKAGTVMTLEHAPKTYWLWSVDEPLIVLETPGDSVPRESTARRRPKSRYTITLTTDRTGQREKIAGLDAEQVTVFMRIDGETYNAETDSVERGSLVVLSDVWLTKFFPGQAAERTFDSAWVARTVRSADSAEMARTAKAMEQAVSEEPRLGLAMMKLDSTLATLKGYSLRTVSYYVAVPDGATFDREQVLRDSEKGLVADLASGAAQNAVDQGKRQLGRLTGGRFALSAPKPQQVVLMRTRHEIADVVAAPIAADAFQAPAGYRRRTPSEVAR